MEREIIRNEASAVLEEYGSQILRALQEHSQAHDTPTGPANLVALMEIFGERLSTIRDAGLIAALREARKSILQYMPQHVGRQMALQAIGEALGEAKYVADDFHDLTRP